MILIYLKNVYKISFVNDPLHHNERKKVKNFSWAEMSNFASSSVVIIKMLRRKVKRIIKCTVGGKQLLRTISRGVEGLETNRLNIERDPLKRKRME